MSMAAANAHALERELPSQLQPPAAASSSPVENLQVSATPNQRALSISSLSDESFSAKKSLTTQAIATEACRDVERELAAIETRLSVFRGRKRRQKSGTFLSAVKPLESKKEDDANHKQKDVTSPFSSNVSSASSPTILKLSEAQREAGVVADQVATTLLKCDQLLQRVKSCESSRKMATSRLSNSNSSRSSASSSPTWDVKTRLIIEDEEAMLTQKAAAVKSFAARCQRDIETSTRKIELHHEQMQSTFLKELQRKYDSKKHMTLMTLREKYEKETKAIVRAKMEEYEIEEATAVKTTQLSLLEDRNRVLKELHTIHTSTMEETLSQLELQLTTETEREKQELVNQLQDELALRLKQLQEETRESFNRWESEERANLEQELFIDREAAVASILKAQEERTATLKQEIQASHREKEGAELEKLQKALAFGAQAQLQQLRKKLELQHEEKVVEMKTEASFLLEKEAQKLTQMLKQSHQEQHNQLKRDLDKKTRVSIMDLHDTMQTAHRKTQETLTEEAERRQSDELAKHRQDFALECRQELQELEQTLDREMTSKLRQLELNHAEECELKMEQLRIRAINQHSRELEAKRSRMIQCKNILLAEATAFLTFDSELSVENEREVKPEDHSTAHLLELKKHLSKELAQYVDVMVTEFEEIVEEQSILAAKITESTQLYLSFKRQCGALEAQSAELTSGLETLHDQLQKKDVMCKKLYQANEALLKRLQTPKLQASSGSTEKNTPRSVKKTFGKVSS